MTGDRGTSILTAGFVAATCAAPALAQAKSEPNDPRFNEQWALHNTGQFGFTADADIDALEAWTIRRSAPGVIVAVIDSGVDYLHPDLRDNIWTNPGEIPGNDIDDDKNGYVDDVHGWSFVEGAEGDPMDTDGHGTAVAGVIGASADNGIGIAGLCRDVRIMVVKVNERNRSTTAAMAAGIRYAVDNGARVLNMSHTWVPDRAYRRALEHADRAGVVMVTGAANDDRGGRDLDRDPVYPAGFELEHKVVAAGSGPGGGPAPSSNFGRRTVDLFAPAELITTTTIEPPGEYAAWSGNSLAAPFVSGTAALIIAERPEWRAAEVIRAILESVDRAEAFGGLARTGGHLNVHSALRAARAEDHRE
ncbi:MAG: S8 family peptidase [Planctomycetota bacterium]